MLNLQAYLQGVSVEIVACVLFAGAFTWTLTCIMAALDLRE